MSPRDLELFEQFVGRGRAAQRAVDELTKQPAAPPVSLRSHHMRALSPAQRSALEQLSARADRVSHSAISVELSTLRSLERRGLVDSEPWTGWAITDAGRAAISKS